MTTPRADGAGNPDSGKMGGWAAGTAGAAVFFSHGVSLVGWDDGGLFDREVDYYRALGEAFGGLIFVTYDLPTRRSVELIDRVAPIRVLPNRHRLHYRLYGLLAPFLWGRELRSCRLFRTNQLSGAWTAAIASRYLRRPLVVRCGFVPSRFADWSGGSRGRISLVMALERLALRAADLVFVATESDRDYLATAHGVEKDRVEILPTPIRTDRFRPGGRTETEPGLVVCVGRLSEQKNLGILIDAIRGVADARLVIIGSGPLEGELRARATGLPIEFLGALRNNEVAAILRRAEIFVLPSVYEGSPKALLEAMASGLAVVGGDVPGVRDIVRHEATGLLVDLTAESLAGAIRRLLRDRPLAERLGIEARRFVLERYSMEAVVRREKEAIERLLCAEGCAHTIAE